MHWGYRNLWLQTVFCCLGLVVLACMLTVSSRTEELVHDAEAEIQTLYDAGYIGDLETTMEIEMNASAPPPAGVAIGDNGTLRAVYLPGYVIENPELCPDGGDILELLVLVTSAPDHLAKRMGIRYTWGHFAARADVSIGFFLGAVENSTTQKRLQEESDIYKDVIQTRNVDRYEALTVKTTALLEWVDDHCPRARFVLKTDDDMFINVPELMAFQLAHAGARNTIFGQLAVGWKPFRGERSKYRITEDQFNGTVLPDFLTGPAYLLTSDVVRPLYLEAMERQFFPLEDVFFTGILAQDLGIRRKHSYKFHRYDEKDACKRQRSISIHAVQYKEQFALWSRALDGTHKCP